MFQNVPSSQKHKNETASEARRAQFMAEMNEANDRLSRLSVMSGF
jgi:hypothetical protein